jgi:hypothetical protein
MMVPRSRGNIHRSAERVPWTNPRLEHIGHALVIRRLHLFHRREHADHGIVDPDINWTKLLFDLARSALDRLGVGYVSWNENGGAAQVFAFLLGRRKCFRIASQQAKFSSAFGIGVCDSAAQPGRRLR